MHELFSLCERVRWLGNIVNVKKKSERVDVGAARGRAGYGMPLDRL